MRAGPAIVVVLVALTPNGSPPSSAGLDRGERVFQRCFACHSVVAGEDQPPGPNLRSVVGRRAGSLPGFRFSPAMVRAGEAGLVWTRRTLDEFLTDPPRVVPGTEMAAPGLDDAAERRAVIDYLERAGRPPARRRH